MKLQKISTFSLLMAALLVTGCTGPGEFFEPTTYGVRNSIWNNMSLAERQDVRQEYFLREQLAIQREMVAEQKRKNDILEKQLKQDRELQKLTHLQK